ncbi:MAG: glycosyltransferase family 2 protein [Microbacteriaceae bacterium]|nr:glycosyltransferase family 2 protein [Microbacteriaceae bacterium]
MDIENPYLRLQPTIDEEFALEADQYFERVKQLPTYRSRIGCVIPAYNESDSISEVLESLLAQTRLPDVIHVVVNNSTDDTVEVASRFAGAHTRTIARVEQTTEIFVHDIGENPDKKVGALNYGFSLIEGSDFMLGVDGDTTAERHAIAHLEAEISSDSRMGGISAIYSIDDTRLGGPVAGFLVAGQRAQFAAFNMKNMLRGRNMAVLGGQYSIFSMRALRDVMAISKQSTPWVRDSEVEDSLLSLQIKSVGYLTKISAHARADVGGMTTLRSLDAQQVKWNAGAIELMWPGQRGDTKGQPFHPNLRLRWFENVSMAMNVLTRALFVMLLAGSLANHSFIFVPLWLIPPVIACLLNVRTAFSMKNHNWRDFTYALWVFPAEFYMWVRIGHFVRAWTKFARNKQVDSWAEQAKAERGSGNVHLMPFLTTLALSAGLVFIWLQLTPSMQSIVLTIGWPILGVTTIVQTFFMFVTLIKPHRGFRV